MGHQIEPDFTLPSRWFLDKEVWLIELWPGISYRRSFHILTVCFCYLKSVSFIPNTQYRSLCCTLNWPSPLHTQRCLNRSPSPPAILLAVSVVQQRSPSCCLQGLSLFMFAPWLYILNKESHQGHFYFIAVCLSYSLPGHWFWNFIFLFSFVQCLRVELVMSLVFEILLHSRLLFGKRGCEQK